MASPEGTTTAGTETLTLTLPKEDEVFRACKAKPLSIDETLRDFMIHRADTPFPSHPGYINRGDAIGKFPDRLRYELLDFTDMGVTPELLWGGEPSRSAKHYYMACVYATMLGRAYTICRELTDPMTGRLDEVMGHVERAFPNVVSRIVCEFISDWYRDVMLIRRGLSIVILEIVNKALGDNRYEEVALRYVAAIVLLTASAVKENTTATKDRALWEDADWSNLLELIQATENLPRTNTDAEDCRRRMKNKEKDPAVAHEINPWIPIEYIPQQTLDALDLARWHVANPVRENWTSSDVFQNRIFQRHFDEALNPTPLRYPGEYDSE